MRLKKHILYRLLVMLVTASILLSSTSLVTMLASAEGTTASNNTTASPAQTVTTTESATVAAEGGKLKPAGPTIAVEGGRLNAAPMSGVTWLGVDGTTVNMGSASNPYAVSSSAHFLAIGNNQSQMINTVGNTAKYFRLTTNIDLSGVVGADFKDNFYFSATLMSLDPNLAAAHPTNIFINLDGNGYKLQNLAATFSQDVGAMFGYLSPNSRIYDIVFENCSLAVPYATARSVAVVAVQNAGVIEGCKFIRTAGNATPTLSLTTQGDGFTGETHTLQSTPNHTVYVGFSAFVADNRGTIQNCYFSNSEISFNRRRYVGTVTGQNAGTIQNINGSAFSEDFGIAGLRITATLNDASEHIGGVAGRNRTGGAIANVSATLPGSTNRLSYGTKVGGIAGSNAGSVANAYIKGKYRNIDTVSAANNDFLGSGTVFGGIVGENTGTVNTSSAENIGMYYSNTQSAVYGGIAGTSTGTISNSYASGRTSDFGSSAQGYFLGGAVGSASGANLLSSCYALVSLSENAALGAALIANGATGAMFHATNHSYWSRSVSGWPTQGALIGANEYDITRGVNTLSVQPGDTVTISKSLMTHSWGAATTAVAGIGGSNAFSDSQSSGNFYINETTTNLFVVAYSSTTSGNNAKITYNLNITLPAGIGATGQPSIVQQMAIDTVVINSANPANAVVTRANPIVLTNNYEVLLLRNVNAANYRLGADIVMPTAAPNQWRTSLFAGTLDGNGKTITTHIPVFSRIYGSRDDTVPVGGAPDTAANLAYGYIHDLNLMLTANTNAGVLGSVMGGTMKAISLSSNNPSVGLYATLQSHSNIGTLFNFVRGNTYVYGCYTDVTVFVQNSNVGFVGGLIGNVAAAKATVDNCVSNADVYSTTEILSIGSLIGGITANTGTIKNSTAAGLVQRGGNIVVGNKDTVHKVENVYWSIKDPDAQQTYTAANNISGADSVVQWAFDEAIGYVSEATSYVNIILPAAINALAQSQTTDFSVQVTTPNTLIVEGMQISGGKLRIALSIHPSASSPINTNIILTHAPTGLKARLNIQDGLSKDGDGYYQIRTAGDLIYFSTNQTKFIDEGTNLKVRLVDDIDMAGYTIAPIGTLAKPFLGVFDGNGYVIDNLTMTYAGTANVALFGYCMGATLRNITLTNASMTNGTQPTTALLVANFAGGIIQNIAIIDSTVTSTYGGNSLAYLGGVVSTFAVGSTATVSGITLENLTINSTAAGGYIGGIAGRVLATTVNISDVTVTDINITGTERLGALIGDSVGSLTIADAQVTATAYETVGGVFTSSSVISGSGYVGGMVGRSTGNAANCLLTDCHVTGLKILNSSTAAAGLGATGGLASWFSGRVGNNPATPSVKETCSVTDAYIVGASVGGIVGRADTSAGNLNLTITDSIVGGTTVVAVSAATVGAASEAGGILGAYPNASATQILTILDCYTQSGVYVGPGQYVGGIVGNISSTASRATITGAQSFATVLAASNQTNVSGGGIIGRSGTRTSYVVMSGCVAGGAIDGAWQAGGITGYQSLNRKYDSADNGGQKHITNSFVTGIIGTTAVSKGKIWGNNATGSDNPLLDTGGVLIPGVIDYVVFSSYPQALPAFGNALYPDAIMRPTFSDVNKPDYDNFQNGDSAPFPLTGADPEKTLYVLNPPYRFFPPAGTTRLQNFVFDAVTGWREESVAFLTVLESYADEVLIRAERTTPYDTGIIGDYTNSAMPIFPDGTSQPLRLRARIPVTCTGIIKNWYGTGTPASPFQIRNVYDLAEMFDNVRTDQLGNPYFGGYYKVMNDIIIDPAQFAVGGDLYNSGRAFIPIIGTGSLPFVGTLDGGDKIIRGLKIFDDDGVNTALFRQSGKQTVRLGGANVTVSATFKDLTIENAVIEGDDFFGQYAGVLVALADSTVFQNVTITGSTTTKTPGYVGAFAGKATDSTLTDGVVSGCTITSSSSGRAGGIAGEFGGTIGAVPAEDYDVRVLNTAVTGGNAGGIIGFNNLLSVSVNYALVSGGAIVSNGTSNNTAAGGIIGYASGLGVPTHTISHSLVAQNTAVTAVYVAGGVFGRMAVTSSSPSTVNLLTISNTVSRASVTATGPSTGTSTAGGIIGNMTNGRIVNITRCGAGGVINANKYLGGIIGHIEGDLPLHTDILNPLVSHTAASASLVSSAPGAVKGLLLGYANTTVMPTGTYTIKPFLNIKYSTYDYALGGLMIGNTVINNTSAPSFVDTVYDLNKGLFDTWAADYRGLRFFNGAEDTNIFVLGNDPIVLSPTNIKEPMVPGTYAITTGDFTSFTDTQGLTFELETVTSNIPNLVVYDPLTGVLQRDTADGAGYLIFRYTNGTQIAMNIISFADLFGTGESDDPYQIRRTEHFMLLRILPDRYYEQVNDIAFDDADFLPGGDHYNGGLLWEPIKGISAGAFFIGKYDGGGFTISGFKVARPSSTVPVGFFSRLAPGARVYDLTLANAQVQGNLNVGALAGEAIGSGTVPVIDNVHITNATVTAAAGSGTAAIPVCAGGIVGIENSQMTQPTLPGIRNSSATSVAVTTGAINHAYAAGIAARAQSVEGCSANNVTVNGGLYAAGIVVRSSDASATGGPNLPMSIINCSVTGASVINAAFANAQSIAGGILTFINKVLQITVQGCEVGSGVSITSATGIAGGIVGTLNIPGGVLTPREDLTLSIIDCQSYAAVSAFSRAGGILGCMQGTASSASTSVLLSNIVIKACVGGGTVSVSTAPGTATGVGGIIGSTRPTSGSYAPTTTDFITASVASAVLEAATGVPRGKLVGGCEGIQPPGAIAEADYPTVFANNIVSAYPQDLPFFGSGAMQASQYYGFCATDLMLVKQTVGDPVDSFTAQNVVNGVPQGDFNPVAIATYDDEETVTSHFLASIEIWDETLGQPVQLAANEPFVLNAEYGMELFIQGVTTTTDADMGFSFTGSGETRALNFSVLPVEKQAGYVEVNLGAGLKLGLPLVMFEIAGNGLPSNPFRLETVEHLTLMYFLPGVSYRQMNDIHIAPEDYEPGGLLYNENTIYEGKGFMPVGRDRSFTTGYQGTPFTGNYNGQGYRVTGIRIINQEADYVGFFGRVTGNATLRNIHLELTENGQAEPGGILGGFFVGGLAGYCDSSITIENCSVVFGIVSGKQSVGGLVGYSSTSLLNCYTASEVLAVGQISGYRGEAGGLVGRFVNDKLSARTINGSFSASNVYSGNQHAGGFVGRMNFPNTTYPLNIQDSFFTGSARYDGGTVSSILVGSGPDNVGNVNASRVYVAGTNVSFVATARPVTNQTGSKTNVYYDVSMLGFTGDEGTPRTTAQLTGGTLPAGFGSSTWTAQADRYPTIIMPDAYGAAVVKMAALPLKTDAREYTGGRNLAGGARFPVTVSATLDGQPLSVKSSKLDNTDTVPYPAGYDTALYGNGSDRATDLLFGTAQGDPSSIAVYRNIFRTDAYPALAQLPARTVQRGELWYSMRSPILTLTAEVDGVVVSRRVRLPQENAANTFYAATERQFRAISAAEAGGTKFGVFAGATGLEAYLVTVHLTASVDLRDVQFTPISLFRGTFNGNGNAVKRLRLNYPSSNDIGLFNKLESEVPDTFVTVRNLSIEDVQITANNAVGAIAGSANQLTLLSNCRVYDSVPGTSVISGNENIGGLIGTTAGTVNGESRSGVAVSGRNLVGGLIGSSSGPVTGCFATGPVTAEIRNTGTVFGVGGLIGRVTNGGVSGCFASGNVFVTQVQNFSNRTGNIGIGGLVGTIITAGSVSTCFASGIVKAENIGMLKNIAGAPAGNLRFGVGGLVGVSERQINLSYSSSSVEANFNGEVQGVNGSPVAAGVGGVAGIARAAVSDAYSSGGVLRTTAFAPVSDAYTIFADAIGGVIGTKAGSVESGYTQLYFDLWNNSYPDLKTIGGLADTSAVRSLTTEQMTISQAERDAAPPPPLQLNRNLWSFNAGAYPCLLSIVQDTSRPYILYPAILSVVSVSPDPRDMSARSGNGVTMAITTPNSLTVLGNTYDLDWKASPESDIFFLEDTAGGTTSRFVPIRTSNNFQTLRLIAEIQDNAQYGSRSFDRLCAEMLGTEEKPFLVSNKSDLQHIGPVTIPTAPGFENFYNQWYSPLERDQAGTLNNVEGKVHFRLLSDIDMIVDVNFVHDPVENKLNVTVNYLGDGDTSNDNHYVDNLSAIADYGAIDFMGIQMDGNDYAIDNFTSDRVFLFGIGANSVVRDVTFNNVNINTVGTAEENAGTALVRYNFGVIDGCMIMSGNITAGSNAAGIVAYNFAELANSTVDIDINAVNNIGGLATVNQPSGTIENSAYVGGLITVGQAEGLEAKAGGIAGINQGAIDSGFSMGAITSPLGATVIGGFVGENTATGQIAAAYSRTNVSGSDIIGGFVGKNAGAVTNAYSACNIAVSAPVLQENFFCALNTGTLTDVYEDKAISGKALYAFIDFGVLTEQITDMSCFSLTGTARDVFTPQPTGTSYPRLTRLLEIADGYAPGEYVPQKYKLLVGFSLVSAATMKTQYSQYIDTLAVGSANPLSTITGVTWTSSDTNVATVTGTTNKVLTALAPGAATVTAEMTVFASNGKEYLATMPLAFEVGAQNPNFSGGNGSPVSPYEISTTDSLNSLAYYGPNGEISYVLTADIDYEGSRPAIPITLFSGMLNGQQHVVYDLTVNNNSGLFGELNGAEIRNLGLVGAKTTTPSAAGNIGLLAGLANNTQLTNCYAVGEIAAAAAHMGALAGYAGPNTVITGCVTSGKIVNTSASETAATGGIVGTADGANILNSLSTAYVRGDGVTGGIAGQLINTSGIYNTTFAGTVQDTALAGGANTPAVTSTHAVAGSVAEDSAVVNSRFDRQMTLVGDADAVGQFTGQLLSGNYYAYDSGLAGAPYPGRFASGLLFAALPIRFMTGSSVGSVGSFSKISVAGTIAADAIALTEIPQNVNTWLTVGAGDPIVATLSSQIDLADRYAGLELRLDNAPGTVFDGMTNDLLRFTRINLARIVGVTYHVMNSSGDPIDAETMAVQVKNKHIFGGQPLTHSSDVFTSPDAPFPPTVELEDLVVSLGGIYAAGHIPSGYTLNITAQDQDNNYLLGSAGPGGGVPLAAYNGEFGCFIPLAEDTTDIRINYTIVKDEPWGVFAVWNSLFDALVRP